MRSVMPSMKFMPAKDMISTGLVTKTIFLRKTGSSKTFFGRIGDMGYNEKRKCRKYCY